MHFEVRETVCVRERDIQRGRERGGVCVCVSARGRERGRKGEGEGGRGGERESERERVGGHLAGASGAAEVHFEVREKVHVLARHERLPEGSIIVSTKINSITVSTITKSIIASTVIQLASTILI